MPLKIAWPVNKNSPITQKFGENPNSGYACTSDGSHNGLDFGIPEGTAVSACAYGTVIAVGDSGDGYGTKVMILHDEWCSLYGHLRSTAVSLNQNVSQGQVIGESGNTGNSTGPHLHFEIRTVPNNCKTCIDPLPLFEEPTYVAKATVISKIGLNVRDFPEINSKRIGGIQYKAVVNIVEKRDGWGRIESPYRGWICFGLDGEDFVKLEEQSEDGEITLTLEEKVNKLWSDHYGN